MRRTSKWSRIAGVVTLGIGLVDMATAQEGPKVARTARGGDLVTTPRHQFEVFFYRTGLRVFPRGTAGVPVDVAKLSGTVTVTIPGAPKPFVYPLKGGPATGGREPESLDLIVDLSRVPVTGSTVAFEVTGLADPAEGRVSFTVPFALVPPANLPQPSPGQGSVPTAPSPRYTYGSGYYGYGYYREYENAGPNTGYSSRNNYRAPVRHAASRARSQIPVDWSTGRQNPLAKPWMRPED
jgi:hypothetical protein